LDGPTQREAGSISAPCCWVTTPKMDACITPGAQGTGMNDRELKRLAEVLAPLQTPKMPLAALPPRDNRFGSPLKLSRVPLGQLGSGRGSHILDLDGGRPSAGGLV
jgi:hypothetical protein